MNKYVYVHVYTYTYRYLLSRKKNQSSLPRVKTPSVHGGIQQCLETLRLKHQLTAEKLINLQDERLAGTMLGLIV